MKNNYFNVRQRLSAITPSHNRVFLCSSVSSASLSVDSLTRNSLPSSSLMVMTTMNKTITSQKWPTMSMKKNSVSEPFRHNHTNLNHIIPLDFNNISNLPNSHTWKSSPDEHRLILDCTQEIVLVINLEHPQAPKLIRHAYEEWGVFQLTNHGIPITIMPHFFFLQRRCLNYISIQNTCISFQINHIHKEKY